MTRAYSLFTVILIVLTVAGCGGGGGSNLSIASFGGNPGNGCSGVTDSNMGCSPPGSSSDTSAASAIITSSNYQAIANRVAYDLDSLLRQRAGLPPTLTDTVASLMQRITQPSSPVCSNDTSNPATDPVTTTYTGTTGSYSVIINDCQMHSDQDYSLTGSFDVSNYASTGTSPWVGSADLVNIDLTYTISANQNLKFDGGLVFSTQYDPTTQVLTSTITPDNLRVIIETGGGAATASTSIFDTFTSGTLTNATDSIGSKQTVTVTAGYFNASITNEQLDIPQSLLVWLGTFENPSDSTQGSGALQITDSTGGSTLLMSPVDETRMDLSLNGTSTVCTGWTEIAPAGCAGP